MIHSKRKQQIHIFNVNLVTDYTRLSIDKSKTNVKTVKRTTKIIITQKIYQIFKDKHIINSQNKINNNI